MPNHESDSDDGALPAAGTAALLVADLTAAGQTVAVAESLTGGQVAASIVDVPGASLVLRGAIVAYSPEIKVDVLGVDQELIAARGTVDADVAASMATRVRDLMGADFGIGTTGVAGPGPQEGKPAGTCYVSVASPSGVLTNALRLNGQRAEVRTACTAAALELLDQVLHAGNKT